MYIELFLFDNMLMDLLIIRLAEALLSVRAGKSRKLLSAFFGTAAALLGAAGMEFFLSPAAKLFIGLIMSFALPAKGLKARLIAFGALLFSAFAIGGALLACAFLSGSTISSGVLKGGLILRTALIGAFVASALPHLACRILMRRVHFEHCARLRVELDGGFIECSALFDTGNSLFEPLSGLPVIVLSERKYPTVAAGADIRIPILTASGSGCIRALKPAKVFINGLPVRSLVAFSACKTALLPACFAFSVNNGNTNNNNYHDPGVQTNVEAVSQTDIKAV